jgi:hypothetical protein
MVVQKYFKIQLWSSCSLRELQYKENNIFKFSGSFQGIPLVKHFARREFKLSKGQQISLRSSILDLAVISTLVYPGKDRYIKELLFNSIALCVP